MKDVPKKTHEQGDQRLIPGPQRRGHITIMQILVLIRILITRGRVTAPLQVEKRKQTRDED